MNHLFVSGAPSSQGHDIRYQVRLEPFGKNACLDDDRVCTHETSESATTGSALSSRPAEKLTSTRFRLYRIGIYAGSIAPTAVAEPT
jgi:hypothetical protein